MAADPIPLFLLTGFLGSGKTTLLSRLIRDPAFADTAVIVNEFGEVGLDHALVSEGREDGAILLDSGCLCCTLSNSLDETLEGLYYKRERGIIPPFARVVVETTGLADPAPIANALAAGRLVSRRFRLAAIITTIDGLHGAQQLDEFDEARAQAAMADRMIVTKGDIAAPEATKTLITHLRAMNPHAEILSAIRGEAPAESILEASPYPTPPSRNTSLRHDDHDHSHDHSDAHVATHGFISYVAHCEAGVSWNQYAAWVEHLQVRLGERLLRVKGLLQIEGTTTCAVHGVRQLFDPPMPIHWSPPPELVGRVVMIARNATRHELASAAELLTGNGNAGPNFPAT